jgi:antitoxin ParD1/3/4
MATRNIYLTGPLDRGIEKRIKSGRYENASEVVRAALRALEREEQEHKAKLDRLNRLLDEGEASGVARDSSLEGILKEAGLSKPRRRRKRA